MQTIAILTALLGLGSAGWVSVAGIDPVALVAQTPPRPGRAGPPAGRPGQGFGQPRDNPEVVVGTSRIAGRVVAADTGRPLRRVQIRVVAQRVAGDGWPPPT